MSVDKSEKKVAEEDFKHEPIFEKCNNFVFDGTLVYWEGNPPKLFV